MTGDYQTDKRMGLKLAAIPFPDFKGKAVLDVGTDHGFFAFMAAERGAGDVLGLDRNRMVRGEQVDLITQNTTEAARRGLRARFEHINIGKQWKLFGRFDVLLVMSVYHHLYENCGDHRPIWFWLWSQCKTGGEVIWEGPVDDGDPVVRANVSDANRAGFTKDAILAAASSFFAAEYVGPALHEPTRQVWRFRPLQVAWQRHAGVLQAGAGGATRAFEYDDGRRMREIERVLGWRPVPGSLNVRLDRAFGWDDAFFRAQILDVKDRARGLQSEWEPRWARFYPVTIDGEDACAIRFEGEKYDQAFLELIAPWRLRDMVSGPKVTIAR